MATASTKNIAYALYESIKGKKGQELDGAFAQVIEFLDKKRLMSKSKQILEDLQRIIDEDEGVVRASIETSRVLSIINQDELEKQIKDRYKAKEVYLDITENPKLLGGLKIQVGDEILDLSLAHQINQLQNHLIAH
jgi:F-type H+-transporting ATPase subunit delta